MLYWSFIMALTGMMVSWGAAADDLTAVVRCSLQPYAFGTLIGICSLGMFGSLSTPKQFLVFSIDSFLGGAALLVAPVVIFTALEAYRRPDFMLYIAGLSIFSIIKVIDVAIKLGLGWLLVAYIYEIRSECT